MTTKTDKNAKKRELAAYLRTLSPEQRQQIAAQYGIFNATTGSQYSPANQCLMVNQLDSVTQVAGFHQWKQAGRQVMKGQSGLMILHPCHPKKADPALSDGQEGPSEAAGRVFFRVAYVWDISQTEPVEATTEANAAA